jgi:regulatory protein
MGDSRKNIKAESPPSATRPRPDRKKAPKKITETYLHNAGLYYLQRFAAGSAHFRDVLRRKIDRSCLHHTDQNKDDCYAMLDTLIGKFTTLGLLNDETYTRNAVSSLRRRGLSERMIVIKLKRHGISAGQVREALNGFNADSLLNEEESEMAAAMKLAQKKKVGPYASGRDYDRNKALAVFARAGFSFDVARKILGMNEDDALDITCARD